MKETCCICEGPIEVLSNGWRHGHNAAPVREGRCCGTCNGMVVVPMRLRTARTAKAEQKQLELNYDG